MVCIFSTVIRSYHSRKQLGSSRSGQKHHVMLLRVGLKLLLLLVCNVLSWLPFLIVSILLVCGIGVHENVLQWVAVLGLPICVCTDPILYNLASLKAYVNKKYGKS